MATPVDYFDDKVEGEQVVALGRGGTLGGRLHSLLNEIAATATPYPVNKTHKARIVAIEVNGSGYSVRAVVDLK